MVLCSRCRKRAWLALNVAVIGDIVCNRCLVSKNRKLPEQRPNWKPPLFVKKPPE
jgi:hypothetical protein